MFLVSDLGSSTIIVVAVSLVVLVAFLRISNIIGDIPNPTRHHQETAEFAQLG